MALETGASLSLKIVFILSNSAGNDVMRHFAAFHLGLHCLPMYPFRGFKYTCTKGYKIASSPNSTNDIVSRRPNMMIKYTAFVDVYLCNL